MQPSDLGGVAAIEEICLSPWTIDQITDELEWPRAVQLVAEEHGESSLLGWCCARQLGPEAELLKIAVGAESRRRGIAELLLESLEAILSSRGVGELFLEVRSRNEPALRLYRKHGFQGVGVRPGYYHNPEDTGLIFKKEL